MKHIIVPQQIPYNKTLFPYFLGGVGIVFQVGGPHQLREVAEPLQIHGTTGILFNYIQVDSLWN